MKKSSSLFELDPNSREYLDKMNNIENLVWEIAKIIYPLKVIEPEIVSRARQNVLDTLKKGI